MFLPYCLLQKRLKVETNCGIVSFAGVGVLDDPFFGETNTNK